MLILLAAQFARAASNFCGDTVTPTLLRASSEPTHPKEPCYVIPGWLLEPY